MARLTVHEVIPGPSMTDGFGVDTAGGKMLIVANRSDFFTDLGQNTTQEASCKAVGRH